MLSSWVILESHPPPVGSKSRDQLALNVICTILFPSMLSSVYPGGDR